MFRALCGIALLALSIVSARAHAASLESTQPIFATDGSKATVLMMAITTNPDAIGFFEAMSMPAADEQGKSVKRFEFSDTKGVLAFNAICIFSKIANGTGSCTLVFHPAEGVSWAKNTGRIHYELSGSEAEKLAAQFTHTDVSGEAFRSSDNKLVLHVDRTGPELVFAITYNE